MTSECASFCSLPKMAFAGPSSLLTKRTRSAGALRALISRGEALCQTRLTVFHLVVAIVLSVLIYSARTGLGAAVAGVKGRLRSSSQPLLAFGGVTSLRQQRPVRQGPAPWDTGWNNTVGLCAIMAAEHVEDVREWLQYYRRAQLLPACTGMLA